VQQLFSYPIEGGGRRTPAPCLRNYCSKGRGHSRPGKIIWLYFRCLRGGMKRENRGMKKLGLYKQISIQALLSCIISTQYTKQLVRYRNRHPFGERELTLHPIVPRTVLPFSINRATLPVHSTRPTLTHLSLAVHPPQASTTTTGLKIAPRRHRCTRFSRTPSEA
jgi:hypothetical protein